MQSRNRVGDVFRKEPPKHPLFQARVPRSRAQNRQQRGDSPSLPTQLLVGTDTGAGRAEAGQRAAYPSLTSPQQRSPLVGKEDLRRMRELPEGLSLELAPRLTSTLTPTLAASSGFPNRSQVWARCPGRKWGVGPRGGQHSRPAAPTPVGEHRHPPSSREGVGATHALPRSPYPEAPSGGLPPKPDPLPHSPRNLEPLGRQPLCLHLSTITIPSLLEEEKEEEEEEGKAGGTGNIKSGQDRGAMHCAPIPGRRE